MKIDPEFANLHRPLTAEERAGLHTDLEAEGILQSLVVWKEEGILLDGHNRLAWAKKKKDFEPPVTEVSFPDRTAALRWAIRHQLSRRNLTPDETALLRGKDYLLEKLPDHRPTKGGKSCHLSGKTDARLAKVHGVSARTIRNDGQFAAAVETIAEHVPQIADMVKSGACPISRATLISAAERLETDAGFAEELKEKLQPSPSPKKKKESPPRDEDLERGKRINIMRNLANDLLCADLSLRKLGAKARLEYWQSSPTVQDISYRALTNLRNDINTWLKEINNVSPTEN